MRGKAARSTRSASAFLSGILVVDVRHALEVIVLCPYNGIVSSTRRIDQAVCHGELMPDADERCAEGNIVGEISDAALLHLGDRLQGTGFVGCNIDLLEHFVQADDRYQQFFCALDWFREVLCVPLW